MFTRLTTLTALAFIATLSIGACCSTPPPEHPVIICAGDAGPDEPFEQDPSFEAKQLSSPCARACSALSSFGCAESRKPPGGRRCLETCKEIAPISSYDPECVATAKNLETLRKCPKAKCAVSP